VEILDGFTVSPRSKDIFYGFISALRAAPAGRVAVDRFHEAVTAGAA
jgi:hypothetical protein